MEEEHFFKTPTPASKVKIEIVSKYFSGWANIISNSTNGNIAYIDLYSGPGLYDDGYKSIPILVLERALGNGLQKKLVTIFNDGDAKLVERLKKNISAIPDIKNLTNSPTVGNEQVGEKLAEQLKKMKLVPTLLFVDPFGYKGLSLSLISSVIKDWGCDCIFFFNYNRINSSIDVAARAELIESIFGKVKADELRQRLKSVKKNDAVSRNKIVMQALEDGLKDIKGKFSINFKFYAKDGIRTSHYLTFVCKDIKGYNLMKSIMHGRSSKIIDGVSYFEFNENPPMKAEELLLFDLTEKPLADLENKLIKDFAGKTISMLNVFDMHNVSTNYISRNYKDALLNLEEAGRIKTEPPVEKRRKKTFSDNVIITFPQNN